MDSKISSNLQEKICANRNIRTAISRESHEWFFHIYFSRYVKCEIAPFHREIFRLTEEKNNIPVALMAFRGSAKSTLVTYSAAIWSVLGKLQYKYVVIFAKTQDQVKQHLTNIKLELETNALLINDFGPFQSKDSEWTSFSLHLPKYNAKIIGASHEQGVRGYHFQEYRPELIVLDDVEDSQSVQTKEGRDKVYEWYTTEVIPLGHTNTKIFVVGNLLHRDSLMARLEKEIASKKRSGIFRRYPIMDAHGRPTWPGMFPTVEKIEELKLRIGDERAWMQEFELQISNDIEQIIKPEDIRRYSRVKEGRDHYLCTLIGVDPAISQQNHADFTGIVAAHVYRADAGLKIYILNQVVNKKMAADEIIGTIKQLYLTFEHDYHARVVVESVAFQTFLAQVLNREGVPAEEFRVKGDKMSRLNVLQKYIKEGTILFPESGAAELIGQIVNFNACQHDDLVDAFSMICNLAIQEDRPPPEVWVI